MKGAHANSVFNRRANLNSTQDGVLLTARTKRQANPVVRLRATSDLARNDVVPHVGVILDALLRLKSEEVELREALLLGVVASLNVWGVQASIKSQPAGL